MLAQQQKERRSSDLEAGASLLAAQHQAAAAHQNKLPQHAGSQDNQQGGGGSSSKHQPLHALLASSRSALVSGTLYVVSSAALTLLNKRVLVGYDFHAVHCLLAFHCLLAVCLVHLAGLAGVGGPLEPISWQLVKVWGPVNLIFVAMLATNFYALQLVGVGMVSILKNLTNLFIITGDWVFFGRTYSCHAWLCLGLMAASVIAGGATDINFTWAGYSWQMVNNCCTAAYALYLSQVTETVSRATHDHKPLSQLSMCYYNNLLSLPLVGLLVLLRGEASGFWGQPALYQPSFQALALLSGLCGFALSFSSIWFVSLTSATLYSLVGSFNKVVVAGVGIWLFSEPTGARNLASIAAGLLAGGVLPLVKMQRRNAASKQQQQQLAVHVQELKS